MDFTIEELVPIVAELADRYNGYEDISVTYETAQQLMGAVLYCIREAGQAEGNAMVSKEGVTARQMYEIGLKRVEEKVKMALDMYNQLLPEFDCYDNLCLYDTFVKGLPEFFKWYDIRFCPQDTILTLDYPVAADLSGYTGIDAVCAFIECVRKEQAVLKRFPREYVIEVLRRHCEEYEENLGGCDCGNCGKNNVNLKENDEGYEEHGLSYKEMIENIAEIVLKDARITGEMR